MQGTEATLQDAAVYSLENITQTQMSPESFSHVRTVAVFMRTYYTPVMAAIGVIGNILSIVVFARSRITHISSSVYLGAAATVNTIFLLSLAVHWLRVFGVAADGAACQFVALVDGACAFLSIWYVVAFATDRCIAVCRPDSAARLCTTFRAKVVAIVLLTTAVVVYVNLSITVGASSVRGSRRRHCRPIRWLHPGIDALDIVDVAVNVAAPYAALLAELLLVAKTTFARRRHHHCTRVAEANAVTAPGPCALLTFVTVFLVLRLPCDVINGLERIYRLNGRRYISSRGIFYMHNIAQHIHNTSYCIHLFVHVATFPQFRACIVELLTRTSRGEGAESEIRMVDANLDDANTVIKLLND